MGRIDQALGGNAFVVDESQCLLHAQKYHRYVATKNQLPWSVGDKAAQFTFKLLFVSICHQINWDFLQRRMFEAFFVPDQKLMWARAGDADSAVIREMLAGYDKPHRIRAAERARYLNETARVIEESYGGTVDALCNTSNVAGPSGLFEKLAGIPAFAEDPLRKKANILAQELAREEIVVFDDAQKIPPGIDYHLIRLYLRTGRVVPKGRTIFEELQKRGAPTRARLVHLLRQAVSDALFLTALYAKQPVHTINYLEWQIARSRCEKDTMNCDGAWPHSMEDQPLRELAGCCPLRDTCTAYQHEGWRKLVEPELKKAFY